MNNMNALLQFAAEGSTVPPKAYAAGVVMTAAAISLGWIGSSYMKALGRNPEAGKAAGQIVIIAAMVEVTALLTFLLAAFLITE